MHLLQVMVTPKAFLGAHVTTQLAGKRRRKIQYCTTEKPFGSGYVWYLRVIFNHLKIKWPFPSYWKFSISGKSLS